MERTLVILKPCTIQRGLIGEIIARFEKKGLILEGVKMTWLTDEILSEHYAHLKERSFFQRVKDAMAVCPVIVCCAYAGRINQWKKCRPGNHPRRLQHECTGKYRTCLRFTGNSRNRIKKIFQ